MTRETDEELKARLAEKMPGPHSCDACDGVDPADVLRHRQRGGKLFRRITVEPVRASITNVSSAPAKNSIEFTTTIGQALVTAVGAFYPSLVAEGMAAGLKVASL